MKLRLKILASISLAVIILMGAMYLISRTVIQRGYSELEDRYVRQGVTQALAAISDELSNLDRTAGDWAPWDDTYAFVRDANPRYVTANLTDDSIANLRLDLVLFVDTTGRVVYGTAFDTGAGKRVPIAGRDERELLAHSSLFKHRDPHSHVTGLLRLRSGPVLVAARPIVTSAWRGPARGTLIMGRRLDDREIRRLSALTRLSLHVLPVEDRRLPSDVRMMRGASGGSRAMVVRPLSAKTVAGYGLINDTDGKPALVLKTSTPRSIYRQGQVSMRLLIASLFLAGLGFGVLILALIERLVLSRLARLSAELDRIGTEGHLAARLSLPGNDEWARLAEAGNSMLAVLERSQQRLKESEASYRAVVEDQTELICRHLPDGTLTFVNQAFCRYFGKTQQELIGRLFKPLMPEEDLEAMQRALAQLGPDNPVATVEHRVLFADGRMHWQQWTDRMLFDEEGSFLGFQAVGRDITVRKEAEERLNYLAYHDGLTGLANRRLFRDRLAQSLASAQRDQSGLAVGLLDLDDFKAVNDALGHEVGDRLLLEVAGRLSECMRASDTIARMGGDEFLFTMWGVDAPQRADALVRRLLGSLLHPFTVDGHEIHVTASMGVCLAPADGNSVDDLVKNADVAMYRAKAKGRNSHEFFSVDMATSLAKRRRLEDRLWKALERHEMHVYYQPFVDLQARSVVGMEALLRWHHPEWGTLLPAQFVVVAEENGFIRALDEWVLRTACAQAREWQRAGFPPLRIAVNLSLRHFEQHERLEELITSVLREAGLEANLLELEIAEGAAGTQRESRFSSLRRVSELGVHVVIDDFGTGYSSLDYIRQIPADVLKIGAAFIADIPDNHADAAVVQAIITMAHNLGRTVAASGVEKPSQLAFLSQNGCDRAQGGLLARPMSVDEVTPAVLSRILENLPPLDLPHPTDRPQPSTRLYSGR